MTSLPGGAREVWWVRLDPTRPDGWQERAASGWPAFLFRYGVLLVGLPISLIADLIVLFERHDVPIFFSAEHAIQLEMLVLVIGIPTGVLAGRVLWRLGERRVAAERLAHAFRLEAAEELTSESSPPG